MLSKSPERAGLSPADQGPTNSILRCGGSWGGGLSTSQRSNMSVPPQFEGEIVIHTRMMIDPNAKTRRGGGKHLGIRRGEILEVIEFTNQEEMLCRNTKGKCE